MATKSKKIVESEPVETKKIVESEQPEVIQPKKEEPIQPKKETPKNKYAIGSIVFISKKAEADLNGFKLFPQYKKYTYTVEAYDEKSGVYSLRRLNLSLKLKEDLILAPDERAHDTLNRKQF